jgi:phospholipase/carboxylesterase
MRKFSEPFIEPASKSIKRAVILLHGYGASGNDLIGLGEAWQAYLPDTLFIAPNGIEPWEGSHGQGYQWFSLSDFTFDTLWRGIELALPSVHHYIDKILAYYDLKESQLALVGFSQGAMLALAASLSRPRSLAAVISYSGVLVYPDAQPITAASPVLLVHGDQDEVVPFSSLKASEDALKKRGVPVTGVICQNIGHGIDNNGLYQGSAFLGRYLNLTDKVNSI